MKNMLDKDFTSSPECIYWVDCDNAIQGQNSIDMSSGKSGTSRAMIAKSIKDFLLPNFDEHILHINNSAINTEDSLLIEKEIKDHDGASHAYLSYKTPFRDEQDNVIGLVSIAFNLNEDVNKSSVKSLVKDNTLLAVQNIIDSLPGNVYWKDKNGTYLGCNLQHAKYLGAKSPAEVIGKTDFDLVSEEEASKHRKLDLSVIKKGYTEFLESIGNREDRNGVYLTRKTPLINEKGTVVGVSGVVFDITERRKLENYEKECTEKTAKAIHLLAGSVVHEMRTPLAVININAELLLNWFKAFPQVAKKLLPVSFCENFLQYLQNIQRSVFATNHVGSMLLMKLRQLTTPVNSLFGNTSGYSINQTIREALGEYPFIEGEEKLIKFDENEDFMYQGDIQFIKHVLFNLIENSLRAIKEAGKGKISIKLKVGKEDEFNCLYFKDTAQGIAKEVLPNIFDQFVCNQQTGSGLGLAFCKMVMMSCDGDIVCNSVVDKYTEFVLSFPQQFGSLE